MLPVGTGSAQPAAPQVAKCDARPVAATVDALRILLVVNAFASSVTARNTVVVHRALSQGNEVEIVETNRRGHATRFAQDAARRGVNLVIGFGGDGTLNEVATGVAGTETALGVLPGGSTNVFARTLGMPNDPVAAVAQLAAGIAAADVSPIGLGRVNGRYFCFHTGVGYDAAVVREVERRASLKRWLGHPLFIYASIRAWASRYDRDAPHFSLASRKAASALASLTLSSCFGVRLCRASTSALAIWKWPLASTLQASLGLPCSFLQLSHSSLYAAWALS